MNYYIKNILYLLIFLSIVINFINIIKHDINNSLICNTKKYNCNNYYKYDIKKEEKKIIIKKYIDIILYCIYVYFIIYLLLN
jgi:hypothetical protein